MKILMVDDDTELLSIFEIALKKEGYEIITAYDGKTGIEKAKAEKPSLILLDQVLPDITGNDIVKLLKEEPETKNIPVAMLSNFGQSELIQEAINQGAVDYILKYQIETQDLVNKVKMLASDNSTNQPAA
jgi:two-component system alkaline phosphatase synthesis response regulator PhoP